MSYYSVTQLDDRRYRIYDPLGVHMDLFIGREKALLFDTGYGFADLASTVRGLTDLPLYIVNSHGHIDHACGNYQFQEPIYIHAKDYPVIQDHHAPYRKNLAIKYAQTARDFFTGQPVHAITPAFDVQQYLQQPIGDLTYIEEGFVFALGGLTLEVIELPGHTPGSIGLLLRDEGILYAADAMNNNLWLFLPEACSLSVYRKTLQKAEALDFSALIISHFPTPLPKAVLHDYADLAAHLDYSQGLPFSAPLAPEADAKLCIRAGFTEQDMGKSGFASIVISADKLD